MENYEPNIHKQVKLNPNPNNSEPSESNHNSDSESNHNSDSESNHNSESSESDNSAEVIANLELPEIIQTLHNGLRDGYNESAIYDYIQALYNIDQEVPSVDYPELINFDSYPGLSTIILDSVRNEGGELIINENSLTANSTNLILQGILDGLNAENPQFQGLYSLQISSNALDGYNVGMDEESMNLLSNIILSPHSQITRLDIRNNNINSDHLNVLLANINIAENHLIANLQEFNFSLNLINQASVGLLTEILANNPNINFEAEYILPEGVVFEGLEALEGNPRFNLVTDESIVTATETTNAQTPSNSININPSHENSLNSSFNLSSHS